MLSAAAAPGGYVLLTENLADFARIATDHLIAGGHHPGVLDSALEPVSRRRWWG